MEEVEAAAAMVVPADQAAISSAIVKIDDATYYLFIYFVSCSDGSPWLYMGKGCCSAVGVVVGSGGGGVHGV